MRWGLLLLLLLNACGLQEQSGYLVGWLCIETEAEACDPGQVCLPHAIVSGVFADFRCRDEASLRPFDDPELGPTEPPLAYCDETYPCPGRAECVFDRVRQDENPSRPLVCQPSSSSPAGGAP